MATREKIHKCTLCHRAFGHECHLARHMEINTCTKSHKCEVCDKVFRTPLQFAIHAKTHTKPTSFKCEVCEKVFKYKHVLSRHMSVHARTELTCKHCGKKFSHQTILDKHIRSSHTRSKISLKCRICEAVFEESSQLASHMQEHTSPNSVSTKYKCNICSEVFDRMDTVKMHIAGHIRAKNNAECGLCGVNLAKISRLSEHIQVHIRNNVTIVMGFMAESGETNRETSDLANNMESDRILSNLPNHNMEPDCISPNSVTMKYRCNICLQVFDRKDLLKTHIADHIRPKNNYECGLCGVNLAKIPRFSEHFQVHITDNVTIVVGIKEEDDVVKGEPRLNDVVEVNGDEGSTSVVESESDWLVTDIKIEETDVA